MTSPIELTLAVLAGMFLAAAIRPFTGAFLQGVRDGYLKSRGTTPPPVAAQHPCAVMHEYIPIDVRDIHINDLPYTATLMWCEKCRSHTTYTFLGAWPLETLLKKESDLAGEIATLRRMAQ